MVRSHGVQVVAGEKEWSRSTEFRCKELSYTVSGLTEGTDYYIRVLAINDAGPGAPGVTEPVTVMEPQGTTQLYTTPERYHTPYPTPYTTLQPQ